MNVNNSTDTNNNNNELPSLMNGLPLIASRWENILIFSVN
jgi:hypothetical protein